MKILMTFFLFLGAFSAKSKQPHSSTWEIDAVFCLGSGSAIFPNIAIESDLTAIDEYLSFLDEKKQATFCFGGELAKVKYIGKGEFKLSLGTGKTNGVKCKYLKDMTYSTIGKNDISLSIPKDFFKGKVPCGKNQGDSEASFALKKLL